MWWYIRDDKEHYIHVTSSNKYEAGPKGKADVWDEVKAKNILKCLPNTIINKDKYYLEPMGDKPVVDENIRAIRTSSYDISSVEPIIKDISEIYSKLRSYQEQRESLNAQLSHIEKEHNDLLHVIELDSPKNVRDGYKLYKALRECRKKRREIKDLMVILNTLEKGLVISNTAESEMSAVDNALKSRLYYFRTLGCDDESSDKE